MSNDKTKDLNDAIQNALNLGGKKPIHTKMNGQKNNNQKTKNVEINKHKHTNPRNEKTKQNKKSNNKQPKKQTSPVKLIALGGLEEVGKNMTVIEYEDEMIIVDCGLEFPTDDMLGVDLVIPDVTYLVKNKEKIKGLVITHGHEDHIGAIPYVLKQVSIPIYATRLTCALIRNKLEEHKLLRSTEMHELNQGDTITLGKNFKVEFIRSCHSIPDSSMLAIYTPAGIIFHTGDFKIDYTPINSEMNDLGRVAEIGNQGVLALLSDSTNSEKKGYTMSESSVGKVLDDLFESCKKRIVVATFASNIHRVQQIISAAEANGRKVAICGRSMINNIEAAKELGYMKVKKNTLIDIDMIKNYPDDRLTIITTGSQGETMSALTKMAAGEYKKVTITSNDLVIISANPIPGNEKAVSRVIDDLMLIGAEVVYSSLADIHVSGHACQEEQRLILSLVKPKYFIPAHGEFRQLRAHAETAKELGIDSKNIFISTNGKVLELSEKEAKFNGTVTAGKVLIDGLGIGDIGNVVLRDRQHLSSDGLIIVVMTMNSSTGEIISGPDVISRGFVYVKESENLMEEIKTEIRKEVFDMQSEGIRNWGTIKSTIKDDLRNYVFKKTQRDPMILPIIMEV